MNYVPRVLLFRWKSFKCVKQGIFTTVKYRKSYPVVKYLGSHLRVDLLTRNNIIMTHMRLNSTFSIKSDKTGGKIDFKTAVILSKFSKLNLELLLENPNNFNEKSLLVLFKKICTVYEINKLDSKFIRNLPLFVKSEEFITFCTLLEKHLPKVMPDDLGILLNFEIFNIPVQCTLMRKILTLILDNLNNISCFNILEIYLQLNLNYFKHSKESERIKEACEVYFANTLEDEISHSRSFVQMINYLNEKDLPLYVRKILAERIMEILRFESFPSAILQRFFNFAFEPHLMELLGDQILNTFKDCVNLSMSTSGLLKLVTSYENAVSRNEMFYREELCEIIAEKAMKSRHYSYCVPIVEKLCLIGYFNEKLLNYTVDCIFSTNFSSLFPSTVLQTASVLARTCYHELNTPVWEKVKEMLQSFKPEESEYFGDFNKFIRWAEYLTFLECDTKELLSTIFTFANEEQNLQSKNLECRNILRLHHFTENYFSSGYTKISEKNLELFLQNAIFPDNIYSLLHVQEFFGGEDYVIRNCTNSHKHFIPLVIILGSDNKPLNLSSMKPQMQDLENLTSKEVSLKFPNIENFSKPPGSRVIAFMIYPDNQPFKYRNAPITSGTSRIFQKSIENLGCDVVLLPRKYPYLEVKNKVKYLQSQMDEIIKKLEYEKSSKIDESLKGHQ